ncbi:thioredoxin family protein [bacterium]|nr:thioredoxin family protein [bacterium]
MIVQVLGMGCAKCNNLEAKVKEVAEKNNIEFVFEKVTDFKKIMDYKVMMTPALVVDGAVKCTGRIPKDDELLKWLQGE